MCASVRVAAEQAKGPGDILAERFREHDCGWCFRGPEGHEVVLDLYGDQVVRCASEDDPWDPAAARAYYRRQAGRLS